MKKTKKYIIVIAIILVILILDQIVKAVMVSQENEVIIFQGILKLNYSENVESTFIMASENTPNAIITEILVLFVLIRFLVSQIDNMSLMPKIAISFIIAGGLTNFVDRIIRGKVINYIDISDLINKFPIFNIADIFIVIGFVIFASTVLIDLIKMRSKS